MPDKLKEYFRESLDKILASVPLKERLKGASGEELARELPPETLQALARLLKGNGHAAEPDTPEDSPRE